MSKITVDMIILVDLVNTLYIKGDGLDKELLEILNNNEERKIIVTNATQDKLDMIGKLPYEVYTLEGNPRKEDSKYFKYLMKKLGIEPSNILYIEHNIEVVKLAETLGIKTLHYDKDKKDYIEVSNFLNK